MRQGDARGPDTIHGFTAEDIARGFREQRALHEYGGMFGHTLLTKEIVPVPIEVTTLYELRQLGTTMRAILSEIQTLNADRLSEYYEREAGR